MQVGLRRAATIALVGCLSVGLEVAGINAGRAVAAPSTAKAPAHRATPTPPPPSTDASSRNNLGDGNLEVTVPPVPPLPVIVHLCEDLTAGTRPDPAGWLPHLEAVTGRSPAATTAWCKTFLALRHLPEPSHPDSPH